MFLLLIRTSALLLLLGVATATKPGDTCRQEIPAELIRDLWSRTAQLTDRLPREEKFSSRLLPKFCTKCSELLIGWLEVKEVLDVYQRKVFSRDAVQSLLPLHYSDLLHRLQHTLQHCVSSADPSKRFKIIKKLERKIIKKNRDERALKAVREFTFVLRWIDELAKHRVL